jgi:hypothetical protein
MADCLQLQHLAGLGITAAPVEDSNNLYASEHLSDATIILQEESAGPALSSLGAAAEAAIAVSSDGRGTSSAHKRRRTEVEVDSYRAVPAISEETAVGTGGEAEAGRGICRKVLPGHSL